MVGETEDAKWTWAASRQNWSTKKNRFLKKNGFRDSFFSYLFSFGFGATPDRLQGLCAQDFFPAVLGET